MYFSTIIYCLCAISGLYCYYITLDYSRDDIQVRLPFWKYYFKSGKFILAPYNSWIDACSPRELISKPIVRDYIRYYPNLRLLEQNWNKIRAESLQLWKSGQTSEIQSDLFFRSIVEKKQWNKYYIKWYGKIRDKARNDCPFICALLDEIPEIQLAMFSILKPGCTIFPHKGPFRGSLRYHLALSVPPDAPCYIQVNNEVYQWKEGKGIVFDDTYVHHVKNKSKEHMRIVLFCDLARPLSSPMKQINCFISNNIVARLTGQNRD